MSGVLPLWYSRRHDRSCWLAWQRAVPPSQAGTTTPTQPAAAAVRSRTGRTSPRGAARGLMAAGAAAAPRAGAGAGARHRPWCASHADHATAVVSAEPPSVLSIQPGQSQYESAQFLDRSCVTCMVFSMKSELPGLRVSAVHSVVHSIANYIVHSNVKSVVHSSSFPMQCPGGSADATTGSPRRPAAVPPVLLSWRLQMWRRGPGRLQCLGTQSLVVKATTISARLQIRRSFIRPGSPPPLAAVSSAS